MLEGEQEIGLTMEKRATGRQSSGPPNKGNGSECKKDNGNNASKYPKCSKKRENARPKNDQAPPRRPNPQKSRALDKRPRARGYTKNPSETEMTTPEDQDPEYGSVQAWGSKKSNMSHLLNFHFEQRETQGFGNGSGRGQANNSYRGRRKWDGRSNVPYNKERFLQANCQFVVSEGESYATHVADPDTLVDWNHIEQVRIFGDEVPSCPICLYPPTAAKITRCGHIYCWTCILHYLSLGEKTWRKCPICYESVHEKDLKSVMALEVRKYEVGDEINMKLMKRERGSTIAVPVERWEDRKEALFNMDDDQECVCYSKLLSASPSQVQKIINMERSELDSQLLTEDDQSGLEVSYIKAALEAVGKRQGNLSPKLQATEELSELVEKMEINVAKPEDTKDNFHHKEDAVCYADAFDQEESLPIPGSPAVLPEPENGEPAILAVDSALSLASMASVTSTSSDAFDSGMEATGEDRADSPNSGSDGTNSPLSLSLGDTRLVNHSRPNTFGSIYYYQADDGQHIYMHSINARCLVKEYGSLEHCPPTITSRIVEIEGASMTEDLRRRLKYLNHLPLTCEFRVAELALLPPVVSYDTLECFCDEIEKRKKMRQRKQRDEKRRCKKIQMEENKMFGIDPNTTIVWSRQSESEPIPVSQYVPPPDSLDNTPIGSPMVTSEELPIGSPLSGGSYDDGQLATMSFAQMLKAGKAKEAWPKTDKPADEAAPGRERKDSQNSDDENRVPVPTFQSSFGDAIQAALDRHKTGGEPVEVVVSAPTAVGDPSSGKKKKKQKKLLFTTTMSRAK